MLYLFVDNVFSIQFFATKEKNLTKLMKYTIDNLIGVVRSLWRRDWRKYSIVNLFVDWARIEEDSQLSIRCCSGSIFLRYIFPI